MRRAHIAALLEPIVGEPLGLWMVRQMPPVKEVKILGYSYHTNASGIVQKPSVVRLKLAHTAMVITSDTITLYSCFEGEIGCHLITIELADPRSLEEWLYWMGTYRILRWVTVVLWSGMLALFAWAFGVF